MSRILNCSKAVFIFTTAFLAAPYCLFAQEANHVLEGIEELKVILLVLAAMPLINLLLLYINFSLKTNAINIITILSSIGFIVLAIVLGEGISVFTIPTIIIGSIGVISGLKNFKSRTEA